jgi:hypothetical protein
LGPLTLAGDSHGRGKRQIGVKSYEKAPSTMRTYNTSWLYALGRVNPARSGASTYESLGISTPVYGASIILPPPITILTCPARS